ncbi:SCO2584 family spore wall biosynthesis protein [Streptomyces beijiangensis]|uniref:Uncharacterized protein n=1 Tax=Streptomyces beijiangensis TaxID=163361 RepID=A0A939JIF3_9ACTN|nr:hypothetical protein [Streptomyces beijiangensis]MBO0513125.1 hypothetical protein [Streptomyces beijiangensis]
MADDVGNRPDDDRGGSDDEFASVVFDEEFVRAAAIHEPSAVERLLAAAEARAAAEAARARAGGDGAHDDYRHGSGYDAYGTGELSTPEAGPYGRHGGALRPYRGSARWHRPIAWMLAMVLGVGMVALAFAAVYRGAAAGRESQVPLPASSGIDAPGAAAPSASADYSVPAVSAVPRTP